MNQCRYYIRSGINARAAGDLDSTVDRQINLDSSTHLDETATLTLPDPLFGLGFVLLVALLLALLEIIVRVIRVIARRLEGRSSLLRFESCHTNTSSR